VSAGRAGHDRWSCLMYHEVAVDSSLANYFAVSRDRFAAHLDTLRGLGLSPQSLEMTLAGNPDAVVAITFDDGHASHYEEAFPLLVERGATATFFVTTGLVGTAGHVTWAQLRAMADAGMSIQSHTTSHPFLSELGWDAAEREIGGSRKDIEQHLGRPCTTLALPGGDPPRGWRNRDYLALGYRCVATSRWGPNDRLRTHGQELSSIRRYTVRRETPEDRLVRLALASEAFGLEGLRYGATHAVRTVLGPTRYSRLRRAILKRLRR
jgi:peptidoglycan/xylan/chitin deacetylase (PgdA/CDA1 family)